jgi:hypothetical protein
MQLNLDILQGYKTYIAAVGLLALGVYQLTGGDLPTGIHSILAGLAAFGLRSALARPTAPPATPSK